MIVRLRTGRRRDLGAEPDLDGSDRLHPHDRAGEDAVEALIGCRLLPMPTGKPSTRTTNVPPSVSPALFAASIAAIIRSAALRIRTAHVARLDVGSDPNRRAPALRPRRCGRRNCACECRAPQETARRSHRGRRASPFRARSRARARCADPAGGTSARPHNRHGPGADWSADRRRR